MALWLTTLVRQDEIMPSSKFVKQVVMPLMRRLCSENLMVKHASQYEQNTRGVSEVTFKLGKSSQALPLPSLSKKFQSTSKSRSGIWQISLSSNRVAILMSKQLWKKLIKRRKSSSKARLVWRLWTGTGCLHFRRSWCLLKAKTLRMK